MIKPEVTLRENQPDDVYHVTEIGNRFHDAGFKINLSAITDYASMGLSASSISAILGLGEKVIYQSAPLTAAYNRGRAYLQMHVAGKALRNMETPAILSKWMDLTNVGAGEPAAGTSSEDVDQSVDVRISFPKKPKDSE